ncbi:MAG: FIST N-terminal domain-containing protein [Acidobacteriota bacterium]
MIRAGSGISMTADTVEAARAAASQALASLAPPVADVAFVFATTAHAGRLPEAAETVRELTLTRSLVGCLGLGVFTMDAEIEGGAGLAVLLIGSDGEVAASPFMEAGAEAPEGSERVGGKIGRRFRSERDGVLVVLPDVRAFRPSSFFEGLRMEIGDVPVVGGASCDDGSLGHALQICGASVERGAISGVMLSGSFSRT